MRLPERDYGYKAGLRPTWGLLQFLGAGLNAVVISGVVGHKSIELAPEVYDRADRSDIRLALGVVGSD